MEPNKSSRFFIDVNGSKRLTPLATVFLIIQIILLIGIFVAIWWINNDKVPDDDISRYNRMPELTVKNLSEQAPFLAKNEVVDIQKKLFKVVSENTSTLSTNHIEAIIRDDVTNGHTFDGKSNYLNMIVDIPSLEQSYEVFYSSNAVIDPDVSTFVLCLEDDAEKTYEKFDCKSSDDRHIREVIVSSYLKYFKHEYFTAYIDPEKPGTIVISPSITYDNDVATKNSYIKEVQESIESLGISSDIYDYYVRTAKDVNYENQE